MATEEISIDFPFKQFLAHLGEASNERILFSGPFGIGKTWFIKRFFAQNPTYEALHLYPVNYSVASNEDIFELVRYDLLKQLILRSDIRWDELAISMDSAAFSIMDAPFQELFTPFLIQLRKIGGGVEQIFSKLGSIQQSLQLKSKLKPHKHKSELVAFLQQQELTVGGLYEYDFFTRLIEACLTQLKGGERSEVETPDLAGSPSLLKSANRPKKEIPNRPKKETVLIIDDLDRMDPEHIFRLLNVFAAHFDLDQGGNKFGFDRVVFVCDHENLRQIFAHRYGEKTDFSGYMDKFFSKGVFSFMNDEAIVESVVKTVSELKRNMGAEVEVYHTIYATIFANLRFILASMVKGKGLTLRKLERLKDKTLFIKRIDPDLGFQIHSIHLMEGLLVIHILLQLFEEEDLRIALSKTERFANSTFASRQNISHYIAQLVVILDYHKHRFMGTSTIYSWNAAKYHIDYSFTLNPSYGPPKLVKSSIGSLNSSLPDMEYNFPYFKFLLTTLDFIKSEQIQVI